MRPINSFLEQIKLLLPGKLSIQEKKKPDLKIPLPSHIHSKAMKINLYRTFRVEPRRRLDLNTDKLTVTISNKPATNLLYSLSVCSGVGQGGLGSARPIYTTQKDHSRLTNKGINFDQTERYFLSREVNGQPYQGKKIK